MHTSKLLRNLEASIVRNLEASSLTSVLFHALRDQGIDWQTLALDDAKRLLLMASRARRNARQRRCVAA